MVHAIRILFLVCLLALTVSFAMQEEMFRFGTGFVTIVILVPPLAGLAMVLIDTFWQRKRLHLVSAVFFGVLGGLLLAFILSLIVDLAVSLYPAPPPASRPAEPSTAVTDPLELLQIYPIDRRPGESEEEFAARKETHIKEMRIRSARETREEFQTYQRRKAAYDDYVAHVRTVQLIKLVLGASAVFLCVTVVLQTKDDFRFVIPYVEFSRQSKGLHPLILDTSVIIDGRIADVAETRVFESPMIVPRFVLGELQSIADSKDKLKRNRGRRGLDVLNRLQTSDAAEIQILDPHTPEVEKAPDVDSKLVALARQMDGRVVTNDYNLNKIARLRDVEVINLNDLSNALKPIVLPGEQLRVRLVKPGEEPGQGIGYLDDGTMVVVEQGREQISNEVALVVTSVLQTSAGRMIFGRLDADTTVSQPGRKTQAT